MVLLRAPRGPSSRKLLNGIIRLQQRQGGMGVKTATVSDFGRPPQFWRILANAAARTPYYAPQHATNGMVIDKRPQWSAMASHSVSNALFGPGQRTDV